MSDQSWKRLKAVHEHLKHGDNIADDELIDIATHLNIVTNAEYAAYLLVCAIAPICGYRPHLTEALLFEPILPLIYCGVESVDEIITWLQSYLKQSSPFEGMEAPGIDWIRWLTTQPQLIQKYLEQEMAKNDALLLEETLKRFASHSKISLDRIVFRPYWGDKLLALAAKVILFFEIPVGDDETYVLENQHPLTKFEKLTEVLAEHDSPGQVQLIVLNSESYFDYLFEVDHRNTRDELPHDVDPKNVQILWLFERKLIHSANPDDIADKRTYEKNTLDLIAAL